MNWYNIIKAKVDTNAFVRSSLACAWSLYTIQMNNCHQTGFDSKLDSLIVYCLSSVCDLSTVTTLLLKPESPAYIGELMNYTCLHYFWSEYKKRWNFNLRFVLNFFGLFKHPLSDDHLWPILICGFSVAAKLAFSDQPRTPQRAERSLWASRRAQ